MKPLWPLAVVVTTLATQVSPAQAPESTLPIEVSVPSAPIPVRGAGATHLFYELHLTNFRAMPLELVRVEVHAGDTEGRLLASYSGQEISDRLVRPGLPRDLPDKRTLGGGLRAVCKRPTKDVYVCGRDGSAFDGTPCYRPPPRQDR